ncbi:hypothetical protein FD733_02245 [Pantoea sp. Eser]|nr:hypothetical protein [Pantoea sp. Eser]
MGYLKGAPDRNDPRYEYGDLYIKVDNHRQIKFEGAAWINHGKFDAVHLDSISYGQEMRELLIELEGVDERIDVGFRGDKLSYDASLNNSGLSDALIGFLDKCHIRLDQWPEQSSD